MDHFKQESREDEARAALLAHIQREAVPDMYDRIAEAHDASLDEDHTGCRAILKECMRLLAAAPAPDHFRDAAKMMSEPADPDPLHLSRILHELAGAASLCWEPRPTGVFDSQLAIQFVEQALAEIRSRMMPAPADVPMPEPDDECTHADDHLYPVWREDQVRTYGAACRAAGEAAGYARGLREVIARTGLTPAEHDVLAERQRQISVEGWAPEHDDDHLSGAIPMAAACYAAQAGTSLNTLEYSAAQNFIRQCWPWNQSWWKPTAPRRDLVKAAALLLAEIERLDRAARKGGAA